MNNSRRGMSLIEGMMAMAVLVIGILGALQGILFASQQNAVAALRNEEKNIAGTVVQFEPMVLTAGRESPRRFQLG